jgi:hypothetical protein
VDAGSYGTSRELAEVYLAAVRRQTASPCLRVTFARRLSSSRLDRARFERIPEDAGKRRSLRTRRKNWKTAVSRSLLRNKPFCRAF